MSGVNEIRSAFVKFFEENGHTAVPSSPLVPRNDPTLMFTNAGMVQFKNVFTGLEKRPYTRAVTAQKCVRAGGKHNDLDNVGYTARHHTFFEMLGNFSFGDYFKEHAIELAWNLLTREFELPVERLLITVYVDDDDAFALWKKIAGLPDRKIIRIAGADNFWAMGEVGPCGPCSEIFYDHGEHIPGGPPGSPDADGDRFIEIWNLVFMQFEQIAADKRVDLPRPSIDTGMGLERIAAVLQGTHDNYAIDLFGALIQAVADATGVDPIGPQKVSHRVIADHLRASAFLIADGVLPGNEGRGYVLRRIMRRAMRHAELLGAKDPLMFKLVPVLVREMGQAYPELVRAEPLITETLKLEERRFRKTLERGLAILDEETKALGRGARLKGEVAFTLYDTYGFPLDLTQDALRPRGIDVDVEAFNAAMERQREMARASWTGSGEAKTDAIWFALREKAGATDFLGYETEDAEGVVQAIVRDGQEVERLAAGESGVVVLNQTPFYAESGGQVGDIGVMHADRLTSRASPTHASSRATCSATVVTVEEGTLRVGERARARRRSCPPHRHSRQSLGDPSAARGAAPGARRSRGTEGFAGRARPASVRLLAPQAAGRGGDRQGRGSRQRAGAAQHPRHHAHNGNRRGDGVGSPRALFGEKYGDEVRVVAMGEPDLPGANAMGWSVELCGGTHVRRTGDIGLISVVGESAVAAGVRRIQATTGDAARHQLNAEGRKLRDLAALVKAPVGEVDGRITQLIEERKRLEQELGETKKKLAMGGGAAGPGSPTSSISTAPNSCA